VLKIIRNHSWQFSARGVEPHRHTGSFKNECKKIIVVRMALHLRRESIMTLKWIAQRLRTGSWTHVSNCLATTMK